MVTRQSVRRTFLGREVAVAFAVITAIYLVRFVRFQPVQIPAYLLIVAYDLIEAAVPVLTPYYPVAFPLFLYVLAIIGAGATRWLRSDEGGKKALFQTVGGVCLVVGTISLLFGLYTGGPLIASTDIPTPLAITTTTGIVLLVTGWWMLRRPTEGFTVNR